MTPGNAKSKSAPLTVLLAEDHTIVRQGLRSLLQAHDDLQVVGEAPDGKQAVELTQALRPNVVVMDLAMEKVNGVDATRQIKRRCPETGVLVLTMHGEPEYVLPAVRAGADGYLLKGSGLSDLVSAIRAVASGKAFFGPEPAKHLAQQARTSPSPSPSSDSPKPLSPREKEVLSLVAEGYSSPQIAEHLSISVKTVENHRSHIMAKLHIHDLAGLVRYAVRTGLVSLHR